MPTMRSYLTVSFAMLAVATLAFSAEAQPYGARSGMRGSTMMLGAGAMGRRMCSPAAAGFSRWRNNRLEQLIKPTEAQRPKFDEFKTASNKAEETLRNACPTSTSSMLPGRMDAMEKRMDALLQAVRSVRPALEDFYATLNDEQKAILNSGSGPRRGLRWRE